MNRHVHTVRADMPLGDVVRFLVEHKISNAPVIDPERKGQHLVGFVSERDCLEILSNEEFYGSPAPPHRAETMMRKHPICVAADTDIFALASIFVNHGYRHLPVTEDSQLLGIVSRRDILRALDKHYQQYCADNTKRRTPVDLMQLVNHRFRVST